MLDYSRLDTEISGKIYELIDDIIKIRRTIMPAVMTYILQSFWELRGYCPNTRTAFAEMSNSCFSLLKSAVLPEEQKK